MLLFQDFQVGNPAHLLLSQENKESLSFFELKQSVLAANFVTNKRVSSNFSTLYIYYLQQVAIRYQMAIIFTNYGILALLMITCGFAQAQTTNRMQYIQNYLMEGDPIKITIQIFNRSHIVYNESFQMIYSLNQPEFTTQMAVPVFPEMDNLTIVASLWSESSRKVLAQSTRNLTRFAKIRNKDENVGLSLELEGVASKPDQNAKYGLHVPVRFMVMVLFSDLALPLQRELFQMFNISTGYRKSYRTYILPPDISQMQIPYRTYKHITEMTNTSHEILLTLKPFSLTYYQIFFGLTNLQFLQKSNPLLAEIYTEETIDLIKQTLFDNNFYLVVLYFSLSFIQFFMQIFAFKNEIEVWKKIENKPGLSIQNLYQRLVSEIIVCLYLYEKEANKLYLGFQIFDLALTCWKITRAVEVSFSGKFLISFRYKQWYHRKVQTADSQATHYTNYLIMGLFFPFILYKLYPIATNSYAYYSQHEVMKYPTIHQVYVFFLQSSVLFILIFGFVMMTPQLYINYKLKSVDHLPWKTLIYRFIYTIIDDIFVFMIDLPWLQRMFSFRDDVIFVFYLVQRRIYRVDKNRLALSSGSINLSEVGKKQHEKAE